VASDFDVVVYGGTAGGVISAVTAARQGLRVALLEAGNHLGGMVTGGLSATDHGEKEVVGGYALEFYERLGRHYDREIEWYPEPQVAEKVLQEMVQEAGAVTVFYQRRLKEKGGVQKQDRRIGAIRTEDDSVFQAAMFLDASYEGDLMAQAGVSYTWGREGAGQYHESLAGVRPRDANHQFDFPIAAYDETGNLLPEIQSGSRGEWGAGDRKIQAYNFRMILTQVRDNRVPFPKPPDYDARPYELLRRFLAEFSRREAVHRASTRSFCRVRSPTRNGISTTADHFQPITSAGAGNIQMRAIKVATRSGRTTSITPRGCFTS
jgi:FAD-dependent oxidoreductase family protein